MRKLFGSIRYQGLWLLRGLIPFWSLFSRYPLIFVPVAAFFVLHWGVALSGFDAVHVIWSDAPWTCVCTGAGIALLSGGVMNATWWLDTRRAAGAIPQKPRPDSEPYVAGWVLLCFLAIAPALARADIFQSEAAVVSSAGAATEDTTQLWLGLHQSRLCVPLGVSLVLLAGMGGYALVPPPSPARDKWLWRLGWGPPAVIAGGYVVVSLIHWFVPDFYIPGLAAPVTGILLLGLLATAATGVHRFGQARLVRWAFYPLAIVVPVVVMLVGGYVEPIHQVPGLEDRYGANPRPRLDEYLKQHRHAPGGPADRPLVNDVTDALKNWQTRPVNAGDGKPVLVLSVSGGASTSAVYVALSLFRLEARFPGFIERVRIIAGASGGMLGAAHFVAQFRPGSPFREDVRAEGYKQFVARGDENKARAFAVAYQKYRDHLDRCACADGGATSEAELAAHQPYWDGMKEMEKFFIRGADKSDPYSGLEADFLSPIFQKWVHKDLNPITRFFPGETDNDRGVALERAWDRHLLGRPKKIDGKNPAPGVVSWEPLAPSLAVPFAELREEEKAGTIPSLVFTPMLVEDGRQLIISNLDLDYMVDWGSLTEPGEPNVVAGAGSETARSPTISALEFFRLFPDAVDTFRLGTAVRLNATFPLFSPAPELPTNPPRRVVDAGYYDNYGLVVASRWIERNRDWFLTFDRPVWVVQLWAYGYSQQSGALTTGPEQDLLDAGDPRAVPDHALRTSSLPVGALFAAWNTSMANRGEERINKVLYRLNFDRQEENKDRAARKEPPRLFPLADRVRKDIGNRDLPMNWVLTAQSLRKLGNASEEFQELADAVQKGREPAPAPQDPRQASPAAIASTNEKAKLVSNLYKLSPKPVTSPKK